MEDRARGDAELLAARLALEEPAGAVLVGGETAAGRADRLAIGGRPTDCPERLPRLIARHPRHLDQGELAGLGGEEEVLGHLSDHIRF